MNIYAFAEGFMKMDESVWRRHANPWSVWTRLLTVVPLLSVAAWSRVWLGWYALLPLGVALLWVWLNTRVFPEPASTNSWASKGTFGERIFLERRPRGVPKHHRRAAAVLASLGGVAAVVWIYGLVVLDVCAAISGATLTIVTKAWFVDRMVWIYDDLHDANPTYSSWLY